MTKRNVHCAAGGQIQLWRGGDSGILLKLAGGGADPVQLNPEEALHLAEVLVQLVANKRGRLILSRTAPAPSSDIPRR